MDVVEDVVGRSYGSVARGWRGLLVAWLCVVAVAVGKREGGDELAVVEAESRYVVVQTVE